MKRWLYILLLTFAASSLHAQFLFRISENGLEKPSYMLGMVGNLSIAHLDSLFGYTEVEAQCQQFCMAEDHTIFSDPSEGMTRLPDGKTIYDVLSKEQIEALDAGVYKVRHQHLADMFEGMGLGWKYSKPHTYTCIFTFSILQEVRNRYPEEHGEQRDIKNEPLEQAKLHGLKVWDIGYDNYTYYDDAYEKTIESGISREFYYLDGNVIVVKQDGVFTPYLAFTDNLGSYLSVVDSLGSRVFFAIYDAWGKQSISTTGNKICLRRGYCGHEMLNEFNLINMNGRIYSPCIGRFLAPDNFVQAPDNTQNFNRYSYCLNNPLKYTDPSGEFWHIVIGAVIGGVVNLAGNWDNCDGFWQGCAAFGVGAAAGAAIAATGGAGAGLGSVIGVSAVGGAGTAATNNIIQQTGKDFSGFENINWKATGKCALVGGVAGSAGGAVGYWAASSNVVVNNINSPLLRSAVVSPLASGAGHVAGGTTCGLVEGRSLKTSISNSFDGLGKDIAIGSAISVASTMGVCYTNKISPWTGTFITEITANDLNLGKEVQRIKSGEIYSKYRHDGAEFYNNPYKQGGYLPQGVQYKEYVVPTDGIYGPGIQRIVVGNDGSWYYTPDHYDTFIKFKP